MKIAQESFPIKLGREALVKVVPIKALVPVVLYRSTPQSRSSDLS